MPVWAQPAPTLPASAILHELKGLKVLGSVLYIAAHPDDENTRLLAYLANGKQYRTGYLSLTRGDGGQNLIGNEQGIELGLIRTNELMAARRIDGAEQFFTRAYDFGYSKTAKETFERWNHEKVLSDVVWVVRKFQPDVIIARFPEDERAGHGHHSASGILAREAFEAAADPKRFPEHFQQGVAPWQPKRMMWNTFSFGGRSTIDSTQFALDAGGYNPLTGLSFGELAGESRSQHKSQGFGVPRSRGSQREFFVPIKGDKPTKDLLDGVDISWNRVMAFGRDNASGTNGQESSKPNIAQSIRIDRTIDSLVQAFQPENPSATVPGLIQLHNIIRNSKEETTWRTAKLKDITDLIVQCLGLYVEATVQQPFIAEGDSVRLTLNMVNRSKVPVLAGKYQVNGQIRDFAKQMPFNENITHNEVVAFPANFMQSQPFWLKSGLAEHMFIIPDQQQIGKPVNDPVNVVVYLSVNQQFGIVLSRPIHYKYTDPVKGEIYQPVFITPRHLVYSDNDLILFKKGTNDSARVNVNVSSWQAMEAKKAVVKVSAPNSVLIAHDTAFSSGYNSLKSYPFTIGNFLQKSGKEKDEMTMQIEAGGKEYTNAQRTIQYDHIPTLRHYYQDKITVLNIDLKLAGKRVGYIEGAGDRVASALEAMGYEVVILKEEDITESNLDKLDAIITGIRAYNVHEYLVKKYDVLMQFVRKGGNLIVQYNTSSNLGPIKAKMGPYPLGIGRTRITDENSPVRFAIPNHPVFNVPNKISQRDFEGWIQERSIYHGADYDKAFAAPLALSDFGEGEETGSLLIAPYGKGNFVYTGLVFFRQLPAAVPGAYRLLANMIGLPQNK